MNAQKKEENLYTQEQVDIKMLQNDNNHLNKTLDRIESHQKWLLGVMTSGFLGLLGLIAHGFKWLI